MLNQNSGRIDWNFFVKININKWSNLKILADFSWYQFCKFYFLVKFDFTKFWPFLIAWDISHKIVTNFSCHLNIVTGYEFWFLWIFSTFWGLNCTQLTKFKAPKMAKTVVLALFHSSKLISRKIWVMEKSWNFHTVWYLLKNQWNLREINLGILEE